MAVAEAGPLISVITPLYNAERTLGACVESVLNQSCRRIELILVDDGSTDGSGALCDGYAARDDRVRAIHQPNGGVSAARNAGLRAARGDYIAWLDSDDRYEPQMLETLLRALQTGDADIATCNYWNLFPDRRTLRYENITRDKTFSRGEYMGYILTKTASSVLWATLMPRGFYQGIAFPEGQTFEDIRVTYRLYERAERVALVAEPLILRERRSDSLSMTRDLRLRADNMRGYIERYQDAVKRWPQYGRAMLVCATWMLAVLRGFILATPPEEFARCRAEIREICRFFRAHRGEIFSTPMSLPRRLVYGFEFGCMTSCSRSLCALSRAFDRLIGHPASCLRRMRLPDLPPFVS